MAVTDLTIIILIAASLWVYDDAKKRGMENAVGYAVLTFALLIIGLPLYLYYRQEHPVRPTTVGTLVSPPTKPKVCPSCRWANEEINQFCSRCGFSFPQNNP